MITEQELFKIIETEIKNLKFRNLTIRLWFIEETRNKTHLKKGHGLLGIIDTLREIATEVRESSSAVRRDSSDGCYIFRIAKKDLRLSRSYFRRLCRHEFYHIAAGHCDKEYGFFRNLIEDIPAELYAYFGMKFYKKSLRTS